MQFKAAISTLTDASAAISQLRAAIDGIEPDLVLFFMSAHYGPRFDRVLAEVREQGYAFSQEERRLGGVGIAAPVFGPGRQVVAEVGVSVPTQRFVAGDEKRLSRLVVACAERITEDIGG